ncbi:MAG: hypothetical protein OES79_03780 [Planctomycetota bacterium]|nr:hypothetical protein [Planctomycetota bacterium]
MASAKTAYAGMPMIRISDMGRMRLEAISFFLVGLLLSAAAIRWLWNHLRTDFPQLPSLSFGRALGAVVLWGLLFIVVLTMISGARELMTPGAWEPDGATYRLQQDVAADHGVERKGIDPGVERERQLGLLRDELQQYAAQHDGRFPAVDQLDEIPFHRFQLPGPSQLRYVYVPGNSVDDGQVPLAYEPDVFGGKSRVLLADGTLISMAFDELQKRLPSGTPP